MKRGAGYVALFAFLIAGLRFAGGPASVKEAATPVQAQASAPAAPATYLRKETKCHAFEYFDGTAAATRGSDANKADADASQYGGIARLIDRFLFQSVESGRASEGKLPVGIRLMIATVPDPHRTHLSMQLDRSLEAIQHAAQDEGYTYDSSWLPWRAERISYSSRADRTAEVKEAAERQQCPGLVAFRRSPTQATPNDCKDAKGAGPQPIDAPYQCGLFVFVVGEEPTAGLNRIQWENALHWIDEHASENRLDRALRVLGPTFSGSMPSFVRAVRDAQSHTIKPSENGAKDNRGAQSASTFTSTLLYSGTISGCPSWKWLTRQFKPPSASGSLVRLADFEQNDALQISRLYKYLVDRGEPLRDVAVLSEDETAYGGLPDEATTGEQNKECEPGYGNSDQPVHLYYPRDISALRSAYEEQSIFSPAPRSDSSAGQAHTVLRPEAKGSGEEGGDSVTPFSGNNLALTEEAQLYGIVNLLKSHNTHYLVLRATNSLDYLFLTRFIHRAYPNAYIITTGSDLLFTREVDSTEFRGVVALSSYPLFPRGQDWTLQSENVPQHAHRVFGASPMEGQYLASRYLIGDQGVSPNEDNCKPFVHAPKKDIPDYALPFWETNANTKTGLIERTGQCGRVSTAQPATWLGVIGRDGYWPVATLKDTMPGWKDPGVAIEDIQRAADDQKTNGKQNAGKKAGDKTEKQVAAGQDTVGPQYLELTGSWRFVSFLTLLLFELHWFACRYGWNRQDLGMFVQFTRIESRRWPVLMAAGWTAICCLLLVLFLTSARMFAYMNFRDQIWVVLIGVALLLACLQGIQEVRWWNRPRMDDATGTTATGRRRHAHLVAIGVMIAAILLFGLAGLRIFGFYLDLGSGIPTAYRSIQITSGVSPLVPLIAILAGFYWWFWQSLCGLAFLGNGRPLLPRSCWERDREEVTRTYDEDRLSNLIDRAAIPFPSFGKSTLLLYLLPLFLVVALPAVLQKSSPRGYGAILESLENSAYIHTLQLLIGIALYLMFFECQQLYSTWTVLHRRLLVPLDGMRLQRTFAALQDLSIHSLWRLSSAGSRGRTKIFALQMDALGNLRRELEAVNAPTAKSAPNEPSDPVGIEDSWTPMAVPSPHSGASRLLKVVQATMVEGRVFAYSRGESGRDFAMLNNGPARDIRIILRECSEIVIEDILMPGWAEEIIPIDVVELTADGKPAQQKIRLSENPCIRAGEEFVCLTYVGYLQNLLGRMRTMVLSTAGLFAAVALAVGMYPFTPRPTITLSLLCMLLMMGTVAGLVFAGLDRDKTLSHITNTEPGSLGIHFWFRLVSFIGVPTLGLLVSQFPEITDFVFSWITPTMSAVK